MATFFDIFFTLWGCGRHFNVADDGCCGKENTLFLIF